jgi:hypothetical protein
MLAGVALAYQQAAGCKLRPATRMVCEGFIAPDFPVDSELLRKWVERNRDAARKHAKRFLADAHEQVFRYSFLHAGEIMPPETERVLIVGREALVALIVVPS